MTAAETVVPPVGDGGDPPAVVETKVVSEEVEQPPQFMVKSYSVRAYTVEHWRVTLLLIIIVGSLYQLLASVSWDTLYVTLEFHTMYAERYPDYWGSALVEPVARFSWNHAGQLWDALWYDETWVIRLAFGRQWKAFIPTEIGTFAGLRPLPYRFLAINPGWYGTFVGLYEVGTERNEYFHIDGVKVVIVFFILGNLMALCFWCTKSIRSWYVGGDVVESPRVSIDEYARRFGLLPNLFARGVGTMIHRPRDNTTIRTLQNALNSYAREEYPKYTEVQRVEAVAEAVKHCYLYCDIEEARAKAWSGRDAWLNIKRFTKFASGRLNWSRDLPDA